MDTARLVGMVTVNGQGSAASIVATPQLPSRGSPPAGYAVPAGKTITVPSTGLVPDTTAADLDVPGGAKTWPKDITYKLVITAQGKSTTEFVKLERGDRFVYLGTVNLSVPTNMEAVNQRLTTLETTTPVASSDFASLPHVTINTNSGADPTTRETYLTGTITINGSQPHSGTTQIRGRGNSTWGYPKKPWRLQLASPGTNLLGMPTERSWAMLANWNDTSKIRNAVGFELASRRPGLPWTPRSRMVELTMNGTYRGLYQLTEHVEVGPDKVNVSLASGTTGLPLTGAYTLEIDRRYIESGDNGFTTSLGVMVGMDDPDGATAAHLTYIQNWIQNFETVLMGSNWLDPTNGYAKYIDMPSWVDWYMVNELIATLDSNEFSSIKMYKTRDTDTTPGRLYLGPTWDHDISMENPTIGIPQDPEAPWVTEPLDLGANGVRPGFRWMARMLQDPVFFQMLVSRWATFKTSITTGDSIFAFMDRTLDRLTFAATRDRRRWTDTSDIHAHTDAMRTWLQTRIAYLSSIWVIDTTAPSVPTSLTATPGDGQVTLSWSASTDNTLVTGYRVYRDGSFIASPTGTSYVDTGRTNGVTYSYTVASRDGSGNLSAQSSPQTATPEAGSSGPSLPTVTTGTLLAHYAADSLGLTDGASVATWAKSGGSGLGDLTSSGTAPTFQTNELNSLPAVRFAGTGYLAVSTGTQAAPYTRFMVLRSTSAPGSNQTPLDANSAVTPIFMNIGGSAFGLYSGTGAVIGGAITYTNPHIVEAVTNDGSSLLGIDGAITTGAAGTNPLAGLRVGANSSGDEKYVGDVFEVIVYSGALDSTDRTAVREYLSDKYGLA